MDKRVLAMMIAQELADAPEDQPLDEFIPYKWGGNDPGEGGIDCSGLIRFCLRIVGLISWKVDMTAQNFYNAYRENEVKAPYHGCLVVYGTGPSDIKHIAFCKNRHMAIGATLWNGRQGVQEHPIHYGRKDDFIAYVDPFV